MDKKEAGKLGAEKSRKIVAILMEQKIKTYLEKPNYCFKCNVLLDYDKRKNKYCSKSCAVALNNKNRKKELKCLNCVSELINTKKFCNKACEAEYKNKQTIRKSEEEGKKVSHSSYRKFLIRNYGAKCMKCGWAEINKFSNKVPIEMNHIDGNSENNKLENLELLCPNCHSLTGNWKFLNNGYGRKNRKKKKVLDCDERKR